jgi:alpha-tubulin suppressor-like RCC1 family protein
MAMSWGFAWANPGVCRSFRYRGIYESTASAADVRPAESWGLNSTSQLGDGGTVRRGTPGSVLGLTDVEAIGAGGLHSLALLANGTVKAWGDNGNGQIGDSTKITRTTPVTVLGLSEVRAIAAGGGHSLALLSDGTVKALGGQT